MPKVVIRLVVPVQIHADCPHRQVVAAVRRLCEVIEASRVEDPSLGGVLKDVSGHVLGSYYVDFAMKETMPSS